MRNTARNTISIKPFNFPSNNLTNPPTFYLFPVLSSEEARFLIIESRDSNARYKRNCQSQNTKMPETAYTVRFRAFLRDIRLYQRRYEYIVHFVHPRFADDREARHKLGDFLRRIVFAAALAGVRGVHAHEIFIGVAKSRRSYCLDSAQAAFRRCRRGASRALHCAPSP